MSNYKDRFLKKLENEAVMEEKREEALSSPISMSSEEDYDSEPELSTDDSDYEDFFNDASDVKDIKVDDEMLEEPEEEEIPDKNKKDKKKKNGRLYRTSEEDIFDGENLDTFKSQEEIYERPLAETVIDERQALSAMSEEEIQYIMDSAMPNVADYYPEMSAAEVALAFASSSSAFTQGVYEQKMDSFAEAEFVSAPVSETYMSSIGNNDYSSYVTADVSTDIVKEDIKETLFGEEKTVQQAEYKAPETVSENTQKILFSAETHNEVAKTEATVSSQAEKTSSYNVFTDQREAYGGSLANAKNTDNQSERDEKDRSVQDTAKAIQESTEKASNFRERTLNSFIEQANGYVLDTAQRMGNTTISAMKRPIEALSYGAENTDEAQMIKKSTDLLKEAVTLASTAGLSSAIVQESKMFGTAGESLVKASEKNPTLFSDLSQKDANGNFAVNNDDLRKSLSKAGVSMQDINLIVKNRDDYTGLFEVRSALKADITEKLSKPGLTDDQRKGLQSQLQALNNGSFMDMSKKPNADMLTNYFAKHENELVRTKLGCVGAGEQANTSTWKNCSPKKIDNILNEVKQKELAEMLKLNPGMSKKEALEKVLAANKGLIGAADLAKKSLPMYQAMRNVGSTAAMAGRNSLAMMKNIIIGGDDGSNLKGLSLMTTALVGKRIDLGAFTIKSPSLTGTVKVAHKILIGTAKGGHKGIATNTARLLKKILIGTKKGGYKGIIASISRFAYHNSFGGKLPTLVREAKSRMDFAKRQLNAKIKAAQKAAYNKTVGAAKEAVTKAAKAAADRVAQTNTAQAIKQAQAKIREQATKIAQTKAAKAAAIAAKKAGKAAGAIAKLPARAMQAAAAGISKLLQFIAGFKKYIAIGVAAVLVTYFLLCLIIFLIMSFTEQTVGSYLTVMMPERDEFIKEQVIRLQGAVKNRKDSVVEIAKGEPQNPEVLAGHKIERYGAPDANGVWSDGYKIYNVDHTGARLGSTANNIKDCIVLAYTATKKNKVTGEEDEETEGDWTVEKEPTVEKLINCYFNALNPKMTDASGKLLEEYFIESDIYDCEAGCEEITYYCDDAIYDGEGDAISRSELDALAEQGVFIHGDLTNEGDYTIYTCQGCEETTYCDEDELIFCTNPIYGTGKNRKKVIGCGGHTETTYHGESMDGAPDDECTNYTEEKHCPGHTVKVCYGHKDIKINIPTFFMKYAFKEMSLKYYINRLGFLTSCATDLFGWDEDDIDWCQALYDEPTWLKNYGIDPGGSGFTSSYTMSQEQIDIAIEDMAKEYPDLSADRLAILSVAYDSIGNIPYYMGGKIYSIGPPAICCAYPPSNGGAFTILGGFGAECDYPDYKDRTAAGLDCSGFVGYVYWMAYGEPVLMGASGCGSECVTIDYMCNHDGAGHLNHISYDELKPGDIGMSGGSHQHIGIYAGNGMWIHCTGQPQNVVVCNNFGGFEVFARYEGLD